MAADCEERNRSIQIASSSKDAQHTDTHLKKLDIFSLSHVELISKITEMIIDGDNRYNRIWDDLVCIHMQPKSTLAESKKIQEIVYNTLNQCEKREKQHHVPSLLLLSSKYYHGWGCDINHKKSIELLEKAIAIGSPYALNMLGNRYQRGLGVQKSIQKAIMLYEKAMELGDGIAMNNIGYVYHKLVIADRNYERAAELYKQAIELGVAAASNNLAHIHERGYLGKINLRKAIEFYKQSAGLGDTCAMNNLSMVYLFGNGCDVNIEKAIEYYAMAMSFGHEQALNEDYMEIFANNIIQLLIEDPEHEKKLVAFHDKYYFVDKSKRTMLDCIYREGIKNEKFHIDWGDRIEPLAPYSKVTRSHSLNLFSGGSHSTVYSKQSTSKQDKSNNDLQSYLSQLSDKTESYSDSYTKLEIDCDIENCCPISLDVPNKPVLVFGHLFDYNSIQQLPENENQKRIHPITRALFSESDIKPDFDEKGRIESTIHNKVLFQQVLKVCETDKIEATLLKSSLLTLKSTILVDSNEDKFYQYFADNFSEFLSKNFLPTNITTLTNAINLAIHNQSQTQANQDNHQSPHQLRMK